MREWSGTRSGCEAGAGKGSTIAAVAAMAAVAALLPFLPLLLLAASPPSTLG